MRQPHPPKQKKWKDNDRQLNSIIMSYDDFQRMDFLKFVGSMVACWIKCLFIQYYVQYLLKLFNKTELKANFNYKIDLVELPCVSNFRACRTTVRFPVDPTTLF